MIKNLWNFKFTLLAAALVAGGVMTLSGVATDGQEPADRPAAVATEPAATVDGLEGETATIDEAAPPADGGTVTADAPPDAPAEPPTEADVPVVEPPPVPEPTTVPGGGITGEGMLPDVPGATPTDAGIGAMTVALIIAALFILPLLIGNYLAKRLRMEDYAWKISLVLATLAASIVVLSLGTFKFGPDLAGGITLIYELEDTAAIQRDEPLIDVPPEARRRTFTMSEMIEALRSRIDPTGTREITIREYGAAAIEIIIPETGPDQLAYVKRRMTEMGLLEFRITADAAQPADRRIIEQARLAPPAQKNVMLGGNHVAEWVEYSVEEFGADPQDRLVTRMANNTPEALVLIDPWNVTGEYLTTSTKGADERGAPAVNFTFDRVGAERFRRLTMENRPDPATGAVRYLGIILDKRLISAPSIRTTISDRGQISGGAMDEAEVDYIISILNAGSLPAALESVPISEEVVSPTLGAVTVEKGRQAIIASAIGVLAFMLFYYRIAGIIACLVLTFNLLLVLALMILINAAFTLPGLAGLVLTVGMSVDANILIYERIREELAHGSMLRMAIRNGFGRAMSAIIDSNVTSIVAGIALYVFATDQVKGFAVTLILGILTSMYTAIFCSRLIYDIAERQGWIKNLSMMQLLSKPNYDFLRARWVAGACSLLLIGVGMAAVVGRGTDLLDIDFTGGSSVTFNFREEYRTPISEVHAALSETDLRDQNLLVVARGAADADGGVSRYSVDTRLPDVDEVKRIIEETFATRLETYQVEISNVRPFEDTGFTGTEATVTVNAGPEFADALGISHDALMEEMRGALDAAGVTGVEVMLHHPEHSRGSVARYTEWNLRLGGLEPAQAQVVLDTLEQRMNTTAMFPLANQIGGRVSRAMQTSAMYAMAVSLLGMILYLWVRFQKVTYGLAAAAALVHDVLITIGMLALSAYVVAYLPGIAAPLQLESFQIGLTIVAALLTIIGYSLNDTIVTFDRLREVKGKSPHITAEMVNRSVNQTLSRTILTAVTTALVVSILYFFGGDGIHSFAFAFLIGVIAGTYSTIFIAAPVLLWLSGAPADAQASESPSPSAAMGRAG